MKTQQVDHTTYYATQTNGGCESVDRLAVTVTLNTTNAPTGNPTQNFCNSSIIDSLKVTGTDVAWYYSYNGGIPITLGTSLSNGYYYASQTLNDCESSVRMMLQ